MAVRVLWAALIAALVAAGGGAYVLYIESVRFSGIAPQPEQVVGAIERDGIVLEVWTAQREYAPGESVTVFGRVRNGGATPFAYATPTPCSPDVQFWVESAYDAFDVTYSTVGSIPCIQVIDARTLAPGASVMHNATWDLQIPGLGTPFPAPAGEYVLAASFPPGAWQDKPLTVRIEITVTGTNAPVLPRDNATAQALALPEVRVWYDAHLGRNNVREENGRWYAQLAGEGWVEVDATLAQELLASKPALESRLISDAGTLRWDVRLLQKLGDPPYELQVVLDAYAGTLVELNTCETACPTAESIREAER